MTDTQTFGSVDIPTENANIRANPPVASGNPQGSSLADRLKAKFAKRNKKRTEVFEAHTRDGDSVWLEFDLDVSEADLKRYQEAGKNRAARRSKKANTAEDTSLQAVSARGVNEKNLRVWIDPPEWDDKAEEWVGHLEDEDGDPLTVRSDEWLGPINATRDDGDPEITDPEDGLVELFGYTSLVSLFEAYMEVVHGDEARVVDPTRAKFGG